MAYSINPYQPKARAAAMRLLVEEGVPSSTVALRAGVHRSTIWRWKQKWDALNKNVQLTNDNRPHRQPPTGSSRFRLAGVTWHIPTDSSRPHSHAWAIPEDMVKRVLEVRAALKRCAEVVWHHLVYVLHYTISLSSVRRILRRHHCFDGVRKKRVRPDNPLRPHVEKPGDLVQIDTIHHIDPCSGRKLYYYTVIDCYTRMTYALVSTQLR